MPVTPARCIRPIISAVAGDMPDILPSQAELIAPRHTRWLQKAFSSAAKTAWCYYPVFLCCFSLSPRREVFVLEREGALWLLVRRIGAEGTQIDLVVPPIPFTPDLLDSFLDDVSRANSRPARILWVDENDARRLPTDRFSLRLKDTEYFYDPTQVAAASGGTYRDLRKRINRFQRRGSARFRELVASDAEACLQVLERWRRGRGRKQRFLLDWAYTRAAVQRYSEWEREDLQGWCVEVNGEVADMRDPAAGKCGFLMQGVALSTGELRMAPSSETTPRWLRRQGSRTRLKRARRPSASFRLE